MVQPGPSNKNNSISRKEWKLRLCLVAVKRFPKNTYFPEMLISGKGKCFHVFGCISKNFLKNIFWCLEKKKENTNPEKHKPQPRKKSSTIATRDRDLATARSRIHEITINASRDRAVDRDLDPVRSREGEIVIDGAISRSVDRSRQTGAREISDPITSTYWTRRNPQSPTTIFICMNFFVIGCREWRTRINSKIYFL